MSASEKHGKSRLKHYREVYCNFAFLSILHFIYRGLPCGLVIQHRSGCVADTVSRFAGSHAITSQMQFRVPPSLTLLFCRKSGFAFCWFSCYYITDTVSRSAESHAIVQSQIRLRVLPVLMLFKIWSMIGKILHTLQLTSTTTCYYQLSCIFTVMSTDWNILFFDTLEKYIGRYIKACGDSVAREEIVKECRDAIINSSLNEEQEVELPEELCLVSILFYNVIFAYWYN